MLTTLSVYALNSTEAVPVHVVVSVVRTTVVGPETGRCMQSVRRPVPVEEALEDVRFATSLQKNHRRKSRSIIPSLAIMLIS